jgi:sulfane dehydrogenase subunit SoxC
VDAGRTWQDAELLGTATDKNTVRFQYMWNRSRGEATLLSRATDETGMVQPTRTQLIERRGLGTDYHFNQIVGWHVRADGQVFFHGET